MISTEKLFGIERENEYKNVGKKERKDVVAPVKVLVLLWLLDIKIEVGLSCTLGVVL